MGYDDLTDEQIDALVDEAVESAEYRQLCAEADEADEREERYGTV